MTQNEVYEEIAKLAVLNKWEVQRVFDAFALVVREQVKKGGALRIAKFGTFSMVDRPAKSLRHPQTGVPIQIPARQALKFKLGGALEQMRKGNFNGWQPKDF